MHGSETRRMTLFESTWARGSARLFAVLPAFLAACTAASSDDSREDFGVVEQAITLCGSYHTTDLNGKGYFIGNNVWNGTGGSQCINVAGGASTMFSVATNTNSSPNTVPTAYPMIVKGCHWGNCTNASGMPVQVSAL